MRWAPGCGCPTGEWSRRHREVQATPGLRLVPLGAMWSAYFVPALPRRRRPKQLYVDITTPATRRGNLIEFIDLDLDVEQLDDGQVRVLDQDEFTTHSRTWAYPHELVHAARRPARRSSALSTVANRLSTALRCRGGLLRRTIACSTSR